MPVSPSYVGIRSWPDPGATSGTPPPKSWAVAVISPPPVAKNVTTTFVAFFDGRGAREARMVLRVRHAARRRAPRPLAVRTGAGGSRGRDEIASVEKSSIPHLVVGREHHILGL